MIESDDNEYQTRLASTLLAVLQSDIDGRTVASRLDIELRLNAFRLIELSLNHKINLTKQELGNISLMADPTANDLIECGSWLFCEIKQQSN